MASASRRRETAPAGLQLEQAALAVEPAAVAGQAAVAAEDAMAAHDDRERVAGVGGADGARQRRVAQLARQLAVRRRLAVRNAADQRPDALLERVPGGGRREREGGARAAEVLAELTPRLVEAVLRARAERGA